MVSTKIDNTVIVRLDIGDELCESIKAVAEKYNINAGIVSGIGVTKEAIIGLYDLENQQFMPTEFNSYMEISNLTGNISNLDGEKYVHLHITLCDDKAQAFGGHLKKAVIGATGEVFITVIDAEINRKFQEETGLNIFDF